MNIDNAKSQMRKGMLEYCILLLLHRGPAYATDIIQQLKAAELIVVEGTLYPLLTRLKNDGLLCYQWQESTQGPPRKYYALTSDGEAALSVLDIAWTELNTTVNILKNLENFADSVRWQLQKVSAEKEKLSADTLRLLGGVRLWQ